MKTPEELRAYKAVWYSTNRERISEQAAAKYRARPKMSEEQKAAEKTSRHSRRKERLLTDPSYREKVNSYARERARKLRADPEKRAAMNEYDKKYRRARAAADPGRKAAQHRQWRGQYPVEAKVEQYLVNAVKARGGMSPKFNDPGRRGAPDRIVCLPGHPSYYVELKRPKIGKLDAHQVRYHEALRAAGQKVWVIWSYEEVDEFFASI